MPDEGVVEAARRGPISINPDGIATVAIGIFSHTVDFGDGDGTGSMTLANVPYDTFSSHSVGQPEVQFSIVEQGDIYGSSGSGYGIFTGPDAANLGVNFEISGPDGFGAAGTIRVESTVRRRADGRDESAAGSRLSGSAFSASSCRSRSCQRASDHRSAPTIQAAARA